jgi:uncharacterized membrane protein YkvA (DUF1232 family)
MKDLKETAKRIFTWKGLVALMATALVMMYFLLKIDIIPDSIPFFGYVDDVFFVLAVFFLAEWLLTKVFPKKHR